MVGQRNTLFSRSENRVEWGYTDQGRGGGELVWSNNEYDYTHACAMMYARCGARRFLDYCIASAGTKSFAQMMPPLTRYYTYAAERGLLRGWERRRK